MLKISDDKEKKIYLLQFGENYLSNMGIFRVIHPSKIAMSKIKSIRQEKDLLYNYNFSLDTLIHKIKFAIFVHKSVIFDFKKLW